jgi:hypothetical protein
VPYWLISNTSINGRRQVDHIPARASTRTLEVIDNGGGRRTWRLPSLNCGYFAATRSIMQYCPAAVPTMKAIATAGTARRSKQTRVHRLCEHEPSSCVGVLLVCYIWQMFITPARLYVHWSEPAYRQARVLALLVAPVFFAAALWVFPVTGITRAVYRVIFGTRHSVRKGPNSLLSRSKTWR